MTTVEEGTKGVMELSIDVREQGPQCVVVLAGELDMQTAPDLSDRLTGLIDGGCRDVVVDVAGLEFMDSSGLAAILGGHKALRERDGKLVLVSPNEHLIKMVRITGLDEVFEIRTSR